jgi:hypothetical protein
MRLLWMLLTSSFLILSLAECSKNELPPVTDSFCQVYEPVIQQKGDSKIVAADGPKRRILANELNYRACPGS